MVIVCLKTCNTTVLLRFVPRTVKNPLPLKFFDPKGVEFRGIFGAEELIKLSLISDDKPKSTEIMPFRAGSGCSCLLT